MEQTKTHKVTKEDIEQIRENLPTEPKKEITFSLKIAGQDQLIQTDNVLETLRSLKTILKPQLIKTVALMDISYNGKVWHRMFKIPMMRYLIQDDVRKMILAKNINQTLGLPLN